MASLKNTLKEIRGKIDAGSHSDAFGLIKEQLDKGVIDYTLFLFAGYVKYISHELTESACFYRKAIELDAEQNRAWQGIFDVFNDSEWSNFSDEFILTVVNHLLKQAPKTDKIAIYEKAKVKFLVKLGKFDALFAMGSDSIEKMDDEIRLEVMKKLDPKNEQHAKLVPLLMNRIEMKSCTNEEDHFTICRLLQLVYAEEFPLWLMDHLRKFAADCRHASIISAALAQLRDHLLDCCCTGDTAMGELLDLCSRLPVNPSAGHSDFCRNLLERLRTNDFNGVYDAILNADDDALFDNALIVLITIFALRQLGQFHRISSLLEKNFGKIFTSLNAVKLLQLKIEANFVISEFAEDFDIVLKEISKLNELDKNLSDRLKCALIQSRIRCGEITQIDKLDSQLSSIFNDDKSNAIDGESQLFASYFLRAHFHFYRNNDNKDAENNDANQNASGNLDAAREEIRRAMQITCPAALSNVCNANALNSQILIARGQRQLAVSQLVNAAQQNAYAAENFRLLAECLFATGVAEKARLCAERAKLLNPKSELTARLLYAIFEKEENSGIKSSKILTDLLKERPNSEWGLRQSAISDINEGRLDAAIEKVQRLVRIKTSKGTGDDAAGQREMCALWIFLSEAYKQHGNIQSAVRACKTVLDIFPSHSSALLQLIQLHQVMGQNESALEMGAKLLENLTSLSADLQYYVKLLHANSLILHVVEEGRLVSEQRQKLPQLFALLRELLEGGNSNVFLQKIVTRSLDVLLRFNDNYFAECVAELGLSNEFWNISSREDAIERKLECLARILKGKPKAANIWNEFALTLLLKFKLNVFQKDVLERSIFCVKNAINSAKSAFKIADYYCTLGRIYTLKNDAKRAQHSFIRAIHLDRHSANAWSLLALLYLRLELLDEALFAMNEAQKINPQLMEAWCAHALHAEATNDYDTMDLYRHTIFLKPTTLAIKKYCYFWVECIRKKIRHEDGAMLNFEMIKDLMCRHNANMHEMIKPNLDRAKISDDFLHALSLLAEGFWHLDEAKDYISAVKNKNIEGLQMNQKRILIKNMESDALADENLDIRLRPLQKLYKISESELFDILRKHPIMTKLFSAIENENVEDFNAAYKANHFPLIVAASIVFGLKIGQKLFAVIENVRPLHKLVDVYPLTGICRSEFVTFQQQDEEEKILVRHDHATEKLHSILLKMSEEMGAEPNDNKISS